MVFTTYSWRISVPSSTLVPLPPVGKKECQVPSVTLFTLSCQPCPTRYHLPSFLDSLVARFRTALRSLRFDCSSVFGLSSQWKLDTPCMKLYVLALLFLLRLRKFPSFIRVPRAQQVFVVQWQLVHTHARMAVNHEKNHDEIASQHRYPVTCRRPTGCSLAITRNRKNSSQ